MSTPGDMTIGSIAPTFTDTSMAITRIAQPPNLCTWDVHHFGDANSPCDCGGWDDIETPHEFG